MDIHQNAVVTPKGRETMVHRVLTLGWSYRAVARAQGVDPKTVRRWVERYQSEGAAGVTRSLLTAAPSAAAHP